LSGIRCELIAAGNEGAAEESAIVGDPIGADGEEFGVGAGGADGEDSGARQLCLRACRRRRLR